jgi:hypothetical protein
MINSNTSSIQLNRCKFDIRPCHNWKKEAVIKREAICAPHREDTRADEILGYDFSYCVGLRIEFNRIKLGQSLTILFVEENQ